MSLTISTSISAFYKRIHSSNIEKPQTHASKVYPLKGEVRGCLGCFSSRTFDKKVGSLSRNFASRCFFSSYRLFCVFLRCHFGAVYLSSSHSNITIPFLLKKMIIGFSKPVSIGKKVLLINRFPDRPFFSLKEYPKEGRMEASQKGKYNLISLGTGRPNL